jgi:hypothetical protein
VFADPGVFAADPGVFAVAAVAQDVGAGNTAIREMPSTAVHSRQPPVRRSHLMAISPRDIIFLGIDEILSRSTQISHARVRCDKLSGFSQRRMSGWLP